VAYQFALEYLESGRAAQSLSRGAERRGNRFMFFGGY